MTKDPRGAPVLEFALNADGAERLGDLTRDNLPDTTGKLPCNLGIIIDGQLYSARTIRSVISSEGTITSNWDQQEVEDLAAVLNAGELPATLSW